MANSRFVRWWPIAVLTLALLGLAVWRAPTGAPSLTPADSSASTASVSGAKPGAARGGAAEASSAAATPSSPAERSPERAAAAFVGSDRCAPCHAEEHAAWQGSQHARAMQHASAATVLGDFEGARLRYAGQVHRFDRQDGKYWVTTDGPDGQLHRYEVLYTFGVEPLQQYLVAGPGGRLQALPFAWDARPRARGGQRWYHLHERESVRAGDVLHWTAASQNWNHMCAECHSTHVTKGYDAAADRFTTTWSEISVGCEGCHGGGARHLDWAEAPTPDPSKGLDVRFDERQNATWTRLPSGTAQRAKSASSGTESAACALCHSRRETLSQPFRHGAPLLDSIALELLTAPFYTPDGVMSDEVFTYGSFQQSKMAHAGVTCSDCHEPHSGRLRAEGNGVCASCHEPARFDVPEHHHHAANAAAAPAANAAAAPAANAAAAPAANAAAAPGAPAAPRCVDCHMPARTYMGVDVRHDHGFRVPRPDLSVRLGIPNPCADCHAQKPARWAADAVRAWLGRPAQGYQTYAEVFARARTAPDDPATAAELQRLAIDRAVPAIARATALASLRVAPTAASLSVLRAALADPDPLLRRSALGALEGYDPRRIAAVAAPLLADPVRGVRASAARVLAGVDLGAMPERAARDLDIALREYIATQTLHADRAEAQNNLGLVFTRMDKPRDAEQAYLAALRIEPGYVPTYVNLADLYRELRRDADGVALLRRGVTRLPEQAELLHALGLALVRQGHHDQALDPLKRAAELAPEQARFQTVYQAALTALRLRPSTPAAHAQPPLGRP
ncbi:multiheme c-type cytochrome [Sorangium sp. So ce1000]|uniref:cytochrome c3 family protein n=1 Tax=Sorangium sp. So ce1000 TaxID=3133325 RepID=UPI003F635E51